MHEMQTILTDVHGVCLSVSLSVTSALNDPGLASLSVATRAVYVVCTGLFDAAFTKCLWPLVAVFDG